MGRRGLLGIALLTSVLAVGVAAANAPAQRAVPAAASAGKANCSRTSTGLVPLTDLGTGTYHGFQGGLYPTGTNTPPAAYATAGMDAARLVRPRDAAGNPKSDGKVVLLSIGMSNANFEFNVFKKLADDTAPRNPALTVVNGAQPSQTADLIRDPSSDFWPTVDQKLKQAGATDAQVQAVWLKEAIASPSGSFPADANELKSDLAAIVSVLRQRFTNLQLVYASSRTYGGYAVTSLNPEPYAYDSGFAVKWLISDYVNGTPSRPWVGWGPYIWTDGTRGRKDGFVWACADVEADGTHPSASGRQKVANQLLSFFQSNPTATPWFAHAFSGTGAQLAITRDVQYGTAAGRPLLLDAYLPPQRTTSTKTRPGVIFIHGGGWHTGDKTEFGREAAQVARNGWVAFSVNYRLAPRYPYPAAVRDVSEAVRWIRSHAAEFGVNPSKLAVYGSSSGANLGDMIATQGRGSHTKGSRVAAVVSLSGPTDLLPMLSHTSANGIRAVMTYVGCQPRICPARYRAASPISYVDRTDTPMFIANSTHEFIPVTQATSLAAKLRRVHVKYKLVIVPGSRHARAYENVIWKSSLKFLERYLGKMPVQNFTPPQLAAPGP